MDDFTRNILGFVFTFAVINSVDGPVAVGPDEPEYWQPEMWLTEKKYDWEMAKQVVQAYRWILGYDAVNISVRMTESFPIEAVSA